VPPEKLAEPPRDPAGGAVVSSRSRSDIVRRPHADAEESGTGTSRGGNQKRVIRWL